MYAAGDAAGALRAFERHLDAHPRDANAWAELAKALWRLGRLEEALAACDRALKLTPAGALHTRTCGEVKRLESPLPDEQQKNLTSRDGELLLALLELGGALLTGT
jgi:tetratricopeptide (TPR) repeat protein